MKKILLITVLLLTNLMSHHATNKQKLMISYAEDWAPYSYRDKNGKMQGILVEIADELLGKRLHLKVRHEGFPWKRAQVLAVEGTFDAVITYPSEKRKDSYYHGKEELTKLEWRGFSSKYSKNHIITMKSEDPLYINDNKLTYCAVLGDETSFDLLNKVNLKINKVKNVETGINYLNEGRTDFFINSRLTTMSIIYRNKLSDDIKMHSKIYKEVPFHFLLSKKSDFNNKIIEELDQLLKEMKEDGSYKKLIEDIETSILHK